MAQDINLWQYLVNIELKHSVTQKMQNVLCWATSSTWWRLLHGFRINMKKIWSPSYFSFVTAWLSYNATNLCRTIQALPSSQHLLIAGPILVDSLVASPLRASPTPSTSVGNIKDKVSPVCICGYINHRAVRIDVTWSTNPASFQTVLPDLKMVHGSISQDHDLC